MKKSFPVLALAALLAIAVAIVLTVVPAGGRGAAPPQTSAGLLPEDPTSLAIASGGGLYIADQDRQQILLRSADGRFHVVAGTGQAGLSGDAGPALDRRIENPYELTASPQGALYFIQSGRYRNRSVGNLTNTVLREVTLVGTIRTVAGLHPDCGAPRPSATSIRARSAEFYGADLSVGRDGTVRVWTTVCPGEHSLGPSLVLSRSGLLVANGRLPAQAATDCGWGVPGAGFIAYGCSSGGARTKHPHSAELLVVRDDHGYHGYHDTISEPNLIAGAPSGEVVAAQNDAIVRVTATGLRVLAGKGALERLFPDAIGIAAINAIAIDSAGRVVVAVNYYARNRHGCANAIAELTPIRQLKVLWRSGAGRTCG